jgi:DNA invertase Pin-like site-specific DNA recombinase
VSGAKVVFAKLDRLTRDVDLLRALVASSVDLVFCDLPSVPPGAMGRFLLTQMASVAELEVGLIGERTKAALAAAKARGVKLGNPNGARADVRSFPDRSFPEHAPSICRIERGRIANSQAVHLRDDGTGRQTIDAN